MERVAIYLRISSDPDGSQTATGRQREDCEKLATAREWEVAGVYEDVDLSAYKRGVVRPAFEKLKRDVAAGHIDIVLCWKLDRLARRSMDFAELDEIAEAAHARIITIVDGIDTGTSAGRVLATIITGLARAESENISVRSRRKAQQVIEQGGVHRGGSRAFGYDKRRTLVVEQEAALIREAAERVLRGESLRSIVFDWEHRGITTTTGRAWSVFPLKRLLTAAFLSGQRERDGLLYPGQWPAILTPAETTRLRAILRDPARAKFSPERARRYLLSGGLLRCGCCGGAMAARPRGDGVRRYVCARAPGSSNCGKLARLADPVEGMVVGMLLAALESPELVAAIARRENGRRDDSIAAAIADDERSLAELTSDFYVERALTKPEFTQARDALVRRIEGHRSQLARSQPVLADVIGADGDVIMERWEKRDLQWRRALLNAVFDKIEVLPALRGRTAFDSSRVRATWRY